MSFDVPHIITALSTVAIIIAVVMFHYEGLYWLGWMGSRRVSEQETRPPHPAVCP